MGTAGTLASQVVYFAGKQATEKAGECLVGHSINDFQNASSLNHQLLTELSYTKAEEGNGMADKKSFKIQLKSLQFENTSFS